jgi:hypothetical protein
MRVVNSFKGFFLPKTVHEMECSAHCYFAVATSPDSNCDLSRIWHDGMEVEGQVKSALRQGFSAFGGGRRTNEGKRVV